jgi:hypothetical protein
MSTKNISGAIAIANNNTTTAATMNKTTTDQPYLGWVKHKEGCLSARARRYENSVLGAYSRPLPLFSFVPFYFLPLSSPPPCRLQKVTAPRTEVEEAEGGR